MSKAQTSTISYADMASKVAGNLLGELKLDEEKNKLQADTNLLIEKMNADGVKVGSRAGKNPDAVACAFYDKLTANGIKPKVASNYLTTFKAHVESGKPITDWNKARTDAKAKAKAKGKGKGKAELSQLLLKAFNHAEFAEACEVIEAEYNDTIKATFHGMVKSWLEAQGIEFKKAE
jgi:hypothetical protein